MNRRWLLSVLLLVAVLSLPGAEIGAQEGEGDYLEPLFRVAYEGTQLHPRFTNGGASWNADETQILYWFTTNVVDVLDADTGERILDLSSKDRELIWVEYAQWNADGTRILTWFSNDYENSDEHAISVWDANTGDALYNFTFHDTRLNYVTWSADERFLVSTPDIGEGTLRIWDINTGTEFQALLGAELIDWNLDRTRFAAWGDDVLYLWLVGGELITIQDEAVHAPRWNPDGSRILSLSYDDGVIKVWDVKTGDELLTLNHDDVDDAIWNSDGTHILSWPDYFDGESGIKVWSVETGEALLTIDQRNVWDVRWSLDETQILSAGDCNHTVYAWSAETGEELFSLKHLQDEFPEGEICTFVRAVWNSDETLIRTITFHGEATRIWDATTGKEIFTFHHNVYTHDNPGYPNNWCVGISVWWPHDENRISYVSPCEGTFAVLDAITGEQLFVLDHVIEEGPENSTSWGWSPDWDHLTSWSNGLMKVWSSTTREVLYVLENRYVLRPLFWTRKRS